MKLWRRALSQTVIRSVISNFVLRVRTSIESELEAQTTCSEGVDANAMESDIVPYLCCRCFCPPVLCCAGIHSFRAIDRCMC